MKRSGNRSIPTPREIQVLNAIVETGTIDSAANVLCLAPSTVDRHVDNLRKKSGLRRLPQITAWAVVHGLIHGTALISLFGGMAPGNVDEL